MELLQLSCIFTPLYVKYLKIQCIQRSYYNIGFKYYQKVKGKRVYLKNLGVSIDKLIGR